jgi:C1A family cysteine protease
VDARVERFHRSAAFRAALGYVLPPVRAPLSTAGGHCVLLVGFDDAAACFVARNSWGRRWGHEGHCVVRYDDVDSAEMFTDLVALR